MTYGGEVILYKQDDRLDLAHGNTVLTKHFELPKNFPKGVIAKIRVTWVHHGVRARYDASFSEERKADGDNKVTGLTNGWNINKYTGFIGYSEYIFNLQAGQLFNMKISQNNTYTDPANSAATLSRTYDIKNLIISLTS